MSVIVDFYSESNQNAEKMLFGSGPDVGQTFKPTSSVPINSAKFNLRRQGTFNGNLQAKLYTMSGTLGSTGLPQTLLSTSDSITANTISTSSGLVEFTFSSPYTVTANSNYVITLTLSGYDGLPFLNEGIYAGIDTTSPTHEGNYVEYVGFWQTAPDWDTIFYVITTAIMTAITASNTVQYSSDAEASTGSYSYVLLKTLTMTDNYTGSWRIVFDVKSSNASNAAYGKVYKNGVAYGNFIETYSTTYVTHSEDFSNISISNGDTIELWSTIMPVSQTASVRNFRVEFTLPVTTTASNTVQYSSNAEVYNVTTVYTKIKEITVTDSYTGSWRIAFQMTPGDVGTSYGKIYKNGVAYGTEQSSASTHPYYSFFTEDFTSISITNGDLIQLYVKNSADDLTWVNLFEIKFSVPSSVSQSNMLLMF